MKKTAIRTAAMVIVLLTVFLSSCGQPSSNKLADKLHSLTPIETSDAALDSNGYNFQSIAGIRDEKGELDSLKELIINQEFFNTYIEKYGLYDLLNHYNGYLSCAMIRSDDGSFDDGYLYIDEINDRDSQIRTELQSLPEYQDLETIVIKADDIKKMHGKDGFYSGKKDEVNEGDTVVGEFNNAQKDNEVYKSSRTNKSEKKYYGDWEVDYTVKYDYNPGKYGWNNGVFEDEYASWEEASNVKVYYKGELLADMVNASPDYYSIECRLIDGKAFIWNDNANNPGQWINWLTGFSASDFENYKSSNNSNDEQTENENNVNVEESTDSETDNKVIDSLQNAKTGSVYTFGMYEQDSNTGNGKEPIEWYVLEKSGDRVLLVSKNVLDAKQLENDSSKTQVTWLDCKLNNWLNNDFVKEAFTDKELNRIVSDVDPSYNKVFLLSWEEAEPYVEDGGFLAYADATEYSKSINHDSNDWWVRSVFYADTTKEINGYVVDGSRISLEGAWLDYGVRPAIWVNANE